MVLFIATTKRLECPYGPKKQLQLIKGSLVWLPLRRTRRHRTIRLLHHFHATSVMMPCAPPVIAPPVLRQNWETLPRLASWWIKPPNVDACPHIIFIRSSVLRSKPTNLLPHGFEAQTKKPSWWFWGLNNQTVDLGFEVQTKKPSLWFWGIVWNTCTREKWDPDRLLHCLARQWS
jgi:hypothetical protein